MKVLFEFKGKGKDLVPAIQKEIKKAELLVRAKTA